MIIELVVKVPYGTKEDIELAVQKWIKIISKITLFKITQKRIIHQIIDEPNEQFIWHIKLKDKGLFSTSKIKLIKRLNAVIITANLMSIEGLKNSMAKNNIKKRVGYTLHSYCKRNEIDVNSLSEEDKVKYVTKLDKEYEEIYTNIINNSGANIKNYVDDEAYDYQDNVFMEVN